MMLTSIARLSLHSKINKDNASRKKQFLPWDRIEKIALILHKADNINKSAIDRFADSTKKFIEVFYIEPGAKAASYADWRCFTKKDASLLKLPVQAAVAELQKKKFDLVINTAREEDLFAAALASTLQAPFKCGNSGRFNTVDLIIKKTEPYQLMDYLNEVLRYLKMIKV